MRKINRTYLFTFLVLFVIIVVVFFNIFTPHLISAGDYSIMTTSYLQDAFAKAFYSWDDRANLGQNNTPFMNYAPYTFLIGLLGKLFFYNGIFIERVVWWIPFFAFAFLSHLYLRRIVPQIGKLGFSSVFVFLFNTYTLMLLGGGQISGVGLAFAISPIILAIFIHLQDKPSFKNSLSAGLLFALQVMFDIRIAYVTMFAVIIYLLVNISKTTFKNFLKSFLYLLVLPAVVTLLLHSFWLLPTLIYHQNPIEQMGEAFNSTKAVTFFSFAKFENSLGLLHPNWPENIFGKVDFMKPEFLFLSLLALSSLLFLTAKHIKLKVKKNILFFVVLGLLGAFLAKGANDPFGGIYLWMFDHVPGFFMFRDPSKWYIWIVLSYSVLIPFSVWNIYEWLQKNHKFSIKTKFFNFQNLFILLVICYFLFLIRPVFQGQVTGAFQSRDFPSDYSSFNTFIANQPKFFRTLWVPVNQRYGDRTSQHPVISGEDFFAATSPQQVIKKLNDKKMQQLLQDAGVKYIVVPDDSEGEIFLTDRKYDEKVRAKTIKDLDANPWLKKKMQFGKMIVYETITHENLFWQADKQLTTTRISPVHYQLHATVGKIQGNVMFSAKYDPYWVAITNDEKIKPLLLENRFNRFYIAKPTKTVDVFYIPQQWVDIGLIISGCSLLLIIFSILVRRRA